jgi:flagellar protein FliS
LIVLVYERLFDHLKIGKKELENGRYAIESFSKAHDLIQQGLVACIDYKEGGDIAQSLGAIYEWSLREIINARVTKSPEKIQEVLDVLTPLYEAWVSLAPKEPVPVLQAVSSSNPARVAAAY